MIGTALGMFQAVRPTSIVSEQADYRPMALIDRTFGTTPIQNAPERVSSLHLNGT